MAIETKIYLAGLTLTFFTSLAVVIYLRNPLHSLLSELCGTRQRADFWQAFSNVSISLSPLVFAMSYSTDLQAETPTVALAGQIKWGLAGLLCVVVIIASTLSRFIARVPQTSASAATHAG